LRVLVVGSIEEAGRDTRTKQLLKEGSQGGIHAQQIRADAQ